MYILWWIDKMLEKPKKEETSSDLAIIGRYILNASIFDEIELLNELNFTKAIHNLKELKFAIAIDNERYDCGSKLGLVKANIALALKDKEISEELKKYLKDITKRMEE